MLATQEIIGYSQAQGVTWEHRDLSDASYRTTQVTGDIFDYRELDPTGADATAPPILNEPNPPDDGTGSLLPYPSFSNPTQPGVGYSVDGIRVSWDYFMMALGSAFPGGFGLVEAAARQSSRVVGYRNAGVRWGQPFEVTYDVNGGVVSRNEWGFNGSLAEVSYGNVSAIYGSSSWGQLAALLTDGTRAALSPKQEELFDRERGRLLSLLRDKESACAKFLMEKLGLSSTGVARAVDAMRPFDGETSTVTMADAGLLPRRYPKTGETVLDSYDLVGTYFIRHRNTLRAASALYATPDDRGAKLNDIYFSSSFDATGILHETLHTFTGMRDEDLTAKLGVKLDGDDSSPISDALRAAGCQ